MIRWAWTWAWVAGVLVLLGEIAFILVPAGRYGGELPLGPTALCTLLGLGLIVVSVLGGLIQLNRATAGGVVRGAKLVSSAYLGYRVYEHFHHRR